MSSFISRVNNFFFVLRKFFAATVSRFSQGARSVYAPLRFRSQQLFSRSVKLSFHRGASRFSSIARSVYAPLCFRSQPFFFRFRENSFRLRFRNRFLLSRGAFMLPFAFEVNNFFRSVKLFVSPWGQSLFFNREERLCSPSLQESHTFLHLG